MYRRTAARTVVAVLAPVLFALQFFAPSGSFASAYTNGDAVAHARPGTIPSGTAPHDETVTCREGGRPGEPTTAPGVRDRHRTTAAPQSDTPRHPPARQSAPQAPGSVASGRATEHPPRAAADHAPAVLQVFRC
ncbi:hypothetical protein GCM10010348_28180 [Streptomyces anthocyanicus]|uniref:Secreted protein n=3 Tax=Streptomyces TaxID=1883 RepID=A0A7U9E0T5_STRLI|nr:MULTISPECIES: hypothetical protein [Streptomyces]EOY51156.1 secreted protein [Streptomyces lividans 1326]MBQ0950081.1 hypothetical protein [Streptomyces sp. RK76]MDX3348565.1 hypothetical protein [Streptomyces sp. ME02-6979A]WSB60176.1 hypothetical protein OIE72_08030 [Streptomyces anthocyanicus]WTC11880.1 hypothetical protein OHA15_30380 [Streptomyces anthocyanicus]